jgi:hypothetical protein
MLQASAREHGYQVIFCSVADSVADSDPNVLGHPDPDPLVRGIDPDPDPSIIMQK